MGFAVLYGNSVNAGAKATLTVSAPAGVTATVTKDNKTYTAVVGEDGTAFFKNLDAGEWLVTIANETQTSSKPVNISTEYSTTIKFFEAPISVIYPEGSTCTATDGTTTLVAPDTTGIWECVVPNTGTWTITATDGENAKSKTVEITDDGQTASVYITYWDGVLYDRGDTRDEVTGGWGAYAYSPYSINNVDILYGTVPNIVIQGTMMNITVPLSDNLNGEACGGSVFVENPIDLTPYSKIAVEYATTAGEIYIGVADKKSVLYKMNAFKSIYSTFPWIVASELDISSVNGEQYIVFLGVATSGAARVQLSKVYLLE